MYPCNQPACCENLSACNVVFPFPYQPYAPPLQTFTTGSWTSGSLKDPEDVLVDRPPLNSGYRLLKSGDSVGLELTVEGATFRFEGSRLDAFLGLLDEVLDVTYAHLEPAQADTFTEMLDRLEATGYDFDAGDSAKACGCPVCRNV